MAACAEIPAGRSVRAWGLLVLVIALGLATDLSLKSWSFATVADEPVELDRHALLDNPAWLRRIPHDPVPLLPGRLLELRLVLNPGAVFGIGPRHHLLFIAFTAMAVLVAIRVFARHTDSRSIVAHVGLGCVLAGGLGNLHDRLAFGRVRDFLHLFPDRHLPLGWHWPGTGSSTELFPWIFNGADVMLLAGIGLILLHLHLADQERGVDHTEADDLTQG